MEAWQQPFRVPRLVERMSDGGIGNGPSRRAHLRDQMWLIVFPTRRDVHFVAHPRHGVLLGIGHRAVIRRADQLRGWWQPFGDGALPGHF